MKTFVTETLNCSQSSGRTCGNPMNAVPPVSSFRRIDLP
jgi:hypothetical protein